MGRFINAAYTRCTWRAAPAAPPQEIGDVIMWKVSGDEEDGVVALELQDENGAGWSCDLYPSAAVAMATGILCAALDAQGRGQRDPDADDAAPQSGEE